MDLEEVDICFLFTKTIHKLLIQLILIKVIIILMYKVLLFST